MDVIIEVSNTLTVSNPSPEMIAWCNKHLVIPNPEYAKRVRMHKWVGNTPSKLYLCQYIGDADLKAEVEEVIASNGLQ